VSLPAEPPTSLVVTERRAGSGAEAAEGDVVLVNYVGVRSADGTQFDANYGAEPFGVVLGAGRVIDGWDQGLVGAQQGQQLQLDIPAELAYGDSPPDGSPIKAGDALSFVIDVVGIGNRYPAPAAEELPVDDQPVTSVAIADTRPGEGPQLQEGDGAYLDLLVARGDTGEVLESTWQPVSPTRISSFGSEGTPPFILEGLAGMQAGGRRVLTVPFDQIVQPDQATQLSIPDGTDMIVVADLIITF